MTNKDFLALIEKEATSIDYDRYLKQLTYKKISSDENLAVFEVSNKYIASWIRFFFVHWDVRTLLLQISPEVFQNHLESI